MFKLKSHLGRTIACLIVAAVTGRGDAADWPCFRGEYRDGICREILALAGAVPGLLLAAFCVYLFRSLIIRSIGVPFLYPSPLPLLALIAGGVVLALAGVTLAASLPAFRISRLDAAVAMRE